MDPAPPDLYSRLLLLGTQVARCRAAALPLLTGDRRPAQLMEFDGETLIPLAPVGCEAVSREQIVLSPLGISELPAGRLVGGLVSAALGVAVTVFASAMMPDGMDLYYAGCGFGFLLMGLWVAGLLPHIGPTATAGPGRIVYGGVVFEAGFDVVAVCGGGWKAGRELVLMSRSGRVRSVWTTDAYISELDGLWREESPTNAT